jgi:fatty-acyl-CoA synthase
MSILNESLATKISSFSISSETSDHDLLPQGGLSYVRGPTNPQLVFATIPQLLRDAVSRFGPRDAAVFCDSGIRMTYYDLDRAVDRLATGFLALGLNKGDRVGIWALNRHEWILTQFATARIGLILVNINPAYRLSELEYVLNKVSCKALVLAKSFKTSEYLSMVCTLAPEMESCKPGQLQAIKLPHLRNVIVMDENPGPGAYSFDHICKLGGPAQQLRLDKIDSSLSPDDPINVQFTSGTTGQPKGATLSHYNIINNARYVTDRIVLCEEDRLAIPVPLYHCFGMVMGVLGAVSKGAAMIFPGESFDATSTLDALEKEKCTAVYGVPTMFVAMLQELDIKPRNLTRMRTGVMAGAPCPADVMKRVNKDMNMPEVTICYGMTETSPVSFQSFVNDTTKQRCETVGRVHPHLEVKVVDEGGNIVPVGKQGELCTRGYSVMKGYWNDPDRTTDSIKDGWMHTGDLAVIDPEGFCSITGRVKDMIIRGGENIYPREIEEFLFSHPNVSEVQVFGIPDPKLGEEVCAWVIVRPDTTLDPAGLKDFCQGQIAHFKIPRHIRIVDELPMTITGKPQKFVMRNQMIELLGMS